jgi:hypothetical protein
MIEEYHFGSITIDGKTYNRDVEVLWSGQVLDWWRKESHVIDTEDLKRALDQGPEVIIIGTGESAVAQVTEQAQKEVKNRGINLIIDDTTEAIKTFNILVEEGKKVIGLFHLTC